MIGIIITEERAAELDFGNQKLIAEIITDVAWLSKSQPDVTESLSLLRNAAESKGRKAEFTELLTRMRALLEKDEQFQATGFVLRFSYTLEDFKYSEEPLLEVFEQPTPFKQKRALQCICDEAKKAGFTGFKALYNSYVAERRIRNERPSGDLPMHPTQFPGQPLELDSGDWLCDNTGVYRITQNGFEYACHHPIMPIQRLANIDTQEEKLRIAFMKGRHWRTIIVGKKELFDASKIIGLAAYGVAATSKCAKALSEYICDIETLNYDDIPQQDSVSKLGWMKDGRFSPYVDDIAFDGEAAYGKIFNAITEKGSFEKWLNIAIKYRNKSKVVQLDLAASFASVLLGKLGMQSFFVHVWGGKSGSGKSTAMQLAAAAWGDPEIGRYVQTFNSTAVGLEKVAGFLRNIPLCIDEGQLRKEKFNVYELAQGTGRTRGNKHGGVDDTPTWNLCILTTGERQIVSESDGAGAFNRVIDAELAPDETLFSPSEALEVIKTFKQNYGHAGRKFIALLTDERIEEAAVMYEKFLNQLLESDTTEKQSAAAAMLLTADAMADDLLFHTGKKMTVSEISAFLKSKASVSVGERGYSYMCDWVAMNANNFDSDNKKGSIYGVIDGDYAYINQSVFRKACRDAGYDDRVLLSWLKSNGLILTRGRRFTRGKRLNGVNVECVAMKMKECDDYDGDEYNCLL